MKHITCFISFTKNVAAALFHCVFMDTISGQSVGLSRLRVGCVDSGLLHAAELGLTSVWRHRRGCRRGEDVRVRPGYKLLTSVNWQQKSNGIGNVAPKPDLLWRVERRRVLVGWARAVPATGNDWNKAKQYADSSLRMVPSDIFSCFSKSCSWKAQLKANWSHSIPVNIIWSILNGQKPS